MAIATRHKPNAHHRKSQAGHHRQGKHYLKPYWPYLPMLVIMGAGIVIDRTWQGADLATGQANVGGALFDSTTRLQALSGSDATWLVTGLTVLSVAALGFFMLRNSLRLHKVIVRGEHYVSSHPMLDIAAVFIFTAGFVLTS